MKVRTSLHKKLVKMYFLRENSYGIYFAARIVWLRQTHVKLGYVRSIKNCRKPV